MLGSWTPRRSSAWAAKGRHGAQKVDRKALEGRGGPRNPPHRPHQPCQEEFGLFSGVLTVPSAGVRKLKRPKLLQRLVRNSQSPEPEDSGSSGCIETPGTSQNVTPWDEACLPTGLGDHLWTSQETSPSCRPTRKQQEFVVSQNTCLVERFWQFNTNPKAMDRC